MAKQGVKGVVAKPKSKLKLNPEREQSTKPETIKKIQQAAKWIAEGKSRATTKELLCEKFGMALATANDYYNEAIKVLIPEDEDEWKKGLIKTNATRLETIYECAMRDGDWKAAREAIAELNKMSGLNNSGVQVGIQTDKQNDTQQIIIKFDQ